MSLYDAACQISEVLEHSSLVFLKTEPDVPDFTSGQAFNLVISGVKQRVELCVTSENIMHIIALLDATIFDKEKVDKLFVWNLKSLASYFHFFTKKFFTPTNLIVDIKIIENFLNIRKKPPENLTEAINRFKQLTTHKGWVALYQTIYLPLTLKVLPSIETTPLLNEASKRCEYPFYEIEGQINGRMNCYKKFSKCYVPHNMGPDIKSVLKPKGYGVRFLYSDFRHCEVNVLQWLSEDPKLKEILESGDDLHIRIYEIVTGTSCDTDVKRNLSKKMFLPVMYGCGALALSNLLSVNESVAFELTERIKHYFNTAWEWMCVRQEEAKNGLIFDYFGRPRLFDSNESYLARNFSVQGVAATVCQEKLIELYNCLDVDRAYIAFSVHDGFGLVVKIEAAKETYDIVKQVCESGSKFCEGLKHKVEVKFGAKLNNLKVLWRD